MGANKNMPSRGAITRLKDQLSRLDDITDIGPVQHPLCDTARNDQHTSASPNHGCVGSILTKVKKKKCDCNPIDRYTHSECPKQGIVQATTRSRATRPRQRPTKLDQEIAGSLRYLAHKHSMGQRLLGDATQTCYVEPNLHVRTYLLQSECL